MPNYIIQLLNIWFCRKLTAIPSGKKIQCNLFTLESVFQSGVSLLELAWSLCPSLPSHLFLMQPVENFWGRQHKNCLPFGIWHHKSWLIDVNWHGKVSLRTTFVSTFRCSQLLLNLAFARGFGSCGLDSEWSCLHSSCSKPDPDALHSLPCIASSNVGVVNFSVSLSLGENSTLACLALSS